MFALRVVSTTWRLFPQAGACHGTQMRGALNKSTSARFGARFIRSSSYCQGHLVRCSLHGHSNWCAYAWCLGCPCCVWVGRKTSRTHDHENLNSRRCLARVPMRLWTDSNKVVRHISMHAWNIGGQCQTSVAQAKFRLTNQPLLEISQRPKMHLLRTAFLGFISLLSLEATATPTPSLEERQTPTISNRVIFSPPTNAGWVDPRVLYARATQLKTGALIATWENYSPEPEAVYFPIYRSTDSGSTWTEIGRVRDTVNGWGLRYQPYLYELPSAIGRFPAGTVLLAGNSIPADLSKTKIDVYASTDGGANWSFVSSVASGGEARPNNGLTPVWEPLLL